MLVGINYSHEAAELVRTGRLVLDRFKFPAWPELLASNPTEVRPYVHFDWFAGRGLPSDRELDEAESLACNTRTPWFNLHFSPAEDGSLREVNRDLAALVERFGSDRIGLENVPWDSSPEFPLPRAAADPDLLSQVVDEFEIGLILDIAHARWAAESIGMEFLTYLDRLPTNRLIELHVTGLGFDKEGRKRDSMPLDATAWSQIAQVLEAAARGDLPVPRIVTLEYGGVGPKFGWRSDSATIEREFNQLLNLIVRIGLPSTQSEFLAIG